jgi:hypothetical protein
VRRPEARAEEEAELYDANGRPKSRVRRPTGTTNTDTPDDEPQLPTSRVRRPGAAGAAVGGAGGDSPGSSASAALSPAQLSAIIRAVEDRLLEEIERRGGLRRGSF